MVRRYTVSTKAPSGRAGYGAVHWFGGTRTTLAGVRAYEARVTG